MQLTLISKKLEAGDAMTFIFQPAEPFAWEPGQLLHYTLAHANPDDRGIVRWFTISAAPFEGHVTITTRLNAKRKSSFKTALSNLPLGGIIEADGLEGEFTVNDLNKKYIFIAGGIGITPFRSILMQLNHYANHIQADLLYVNDDTQFVFEDELTALLPTQPYLHLHKISGRHISEADITSVTNDLTQPLFYISGPKQMVLNYQDMLLHMGVPQANIRLDKFPGYDSAK